MAMLALRESQPYPQVCCRKRISAAATITKSQRCDAWTLPTSRDRAHLIGVDHALDRVRARCYACAPETEERDAGIREDPLREARPHRRRHDQPAGPDERDRSADVGGTA